MMGRLLLVLTCCAWVASSCGEASNDRGLQSSEREEIEKWEEDFKRFFKSADGVDWADSEVQSSVSRLLRGYADFANRHHGDSLAGAFLMRRADLLQGRGDVDAALSQWLNVVEGYPQTSFAPEAIFRMGFARETALLDTAGALKAYGQLVEVYPESSWSEQARQSLKWLTFNEAQMMRALEAGQ